MTVKPILAALLVAATACGTSAETERKLADLETANAQRDSLLQEVAVSARLLSDVSTALSKVRVRGRAIRTSSETPLLAQRDSMMQKLRYVVARVSETETALTAAQNRIKGLTNLSDSLRATLDSTATNLGAIIESQTTIASLTEQVTSLETENVALRDTVANVTTRENTVYYIIGTKDELKQKGVIVEEGGSRVLFVLWRTGSTLAPAREIDPSLFTPINKREVTQIQLPDASSEYRIASRQDLEYLTTPRAENGKITGTGSLDISAPELFWRNSKFLIIVQEGHTSGGPNTGGRTE